MMDRNILDSFKEKSQFATCLVPMLDAIGWKGDSADLFQALPHTGMVMDQSDFINILANLKYESRLIQTRVSSLDHRLMPCLFVSNKGEVSVMVRRDKDGIFSFIGKTGTYGLIPVSRQKGIAVVFIGMTKESLALHQTQSNWFKQVMGRFSNAFGTVLFLSLILSILSFLSPLLVKSIYDQLVLTDSNRPLFFLGMGIVLFVTADAGFRLLRSHLLGYVSVRLGNIVGNEVLRRILYLPPAMTESASLGSQIARVRDFETVRDFMGGAGVEALFDLPFICLLIGGMLAIGGTVAYVPVAAILLFIVLGFIVIPAIRNQNAESSKAGAKKHEFVMDMLTKLRTIKYTGSRKYWAVRYRELSAEASMSNYHSIRLSGVVSALSQMLVNAAGLATMAVGVNNVLAGKMGMGALMACMLLVTRVLAPLRTGFGVITQLENIKKSILQLDRLMNLAMEKQFDNATNIIGRKKIQRVAFSQVGIRYSPNAHPALIGVTFDVKPGELMVIVGHDGAGKSTICKLILGLYHPQAGGIVIDNMNIRQMDNITLRTGIAYAPQTHHLFHGSIAQNLLIAKPTGSEDELQKAAKKAGILDEIMAMPKGFATQIGTHNIEQLPNSFKKRLILARDFLKDCAFQIFDEPEKGLDIEGESHFIETIKKQKGDRTMIVVTHDPAFFEIADKVIWLEKGRIRMEGSPAKVAEEYMKAMAWS
ncbi:MAG: ATP-binding cassette domain-containing protein [Desulfamplus sp.]|nr:ATP-binding cassette domain-containing protein [Desulfamplus sp.]